MGFSSCQFLYHGQTQNQMRRKPLLRSAVPSPSSVAMRTTLVPCILGATKSSGQLCILCPQIPGSVAPHRGLRSLRSIINRDDALSLLAVTEEANRPSDLLKWVTDTPGISALCTIKQLPAPSRLALWIGVCAWDASVEEYSVCRSGGRGQRQCLWDRITGCV